MALFHEPKICQWLHAPGVRGLAWSTTSRRRHKVTGEKINRVAVEITRLDQNGKEVDSLKIFKEQPWIFAYNGMICSY